MKTSKRSSEKMLSCRWLELDHLAVGGKKNEKFDCILHDSWRDAKWSSAAA